MGPLYKLKLLVPYPYFDLLRSYISERSFQVKLENAVFNSYASMVKVPQGSVLRPLLYAFFTADLSSSNDTNIATFADDTVIMSNDCDHIKASQNLQTHIASIESWLEKWRFETNTSKSTQVTFTPKK